MSAIPPNDGSETTVVLTVLTNTTTASGLEWVPALWVAPALDSADVNDWLTIHGVMDDACTDTYVLVTPEEDWPVFDLGDCPNCTVTLPHDQYTALRAAVMESCDEDR
ncbi:hypothetical protein [Nocardia terpenica]|uniref:Uncharacterized protein n=1 Tax=Nocardia terpenica TaxID=455432 RepID=A0A6G9ZE53_9NOCA|nr:hypothetical protein [Nocardia terpenica]QIS23720.1 hypothetical protein F6W96_41010 [Nocardia terpenica]